MHILMVTPRYLPEMGGIETHVHEVSRRLGTRGRQIDILTTDRSGLLPEHEAVAEGVTVRRVRAWPKQRDYYLAPALYQQIIATPCDIVHVQGYHTFVPPLAMLAARRKGLPFVITFHSGGHSSPLRNVLRAPQWYGLSLLVRRAHHCIGVSRYEADLFSAKMKVPRERFSVIPNGAQMPRLIDTTPAEGGPSVVSIGRLERYKGHHRVVEAFPKVLRRIPDAKLRVLGEGPYKGHIIALVDRLGLGEQVTVGGIPPADRNGVAAVLGRAALVVLLSDYEAHPVAVMEALALGRRVLVTDSSGFKEMVEQNLVEAIPLRASTAQIAQAIVEQIGKGPAVQAVNLPTWEACAESLEAVYRRVLH